MRLNLYLETAISENTPAIPESAIVEEDGQEPSPLYRRLLGASYDTLDEPVRDAFSSPFLENAGLAT